MAISDATSFRKPQIYFKHLYGANPYEWGVMGFPTTQSPSSALRGYNRGDLVFVAVTKSSKGHAAEWTHFAGQIFGACTLYSRDVKTAVVANPDMVRAYPEVASRWPNATPLDQFWSFKKPIDYGLICDGNFMNAIRTRRGQMINLAEYPETLHQFRRLYDEAPRTEETVYRSADTQRYIADLKAAGQIVR